MSDIEPSSDSHVNEGKVFSVLAYLSIFCIIPLLFKRDNPFVLWHGKHGLVLFVLQVSAFILSIIFPWILKPVTFVIGIFSIWGIVEVLKGNQTKLPVISEIAEQITL